MRPIFSMQLQHFIKEKLEKNEFTAALANEELVFFMFLFRAKIHEVPKLREEGSPKIPLQCARVIRMVRDGCFGFKDYFQSLCDTVDGGKDFYLLGSDFESYLEEQAAVDKAFADPNKWTQMSILSTAGSGIFSSDRTIQDYAEKTWGIEPCRFPSDG
ncbi:PREDICTED: alpha-glucan phosphorylase, H isozyme-like [Prunus mume]|uniref:Alpha-1,4 glucan phosphorylase n=1 Tax=Prunus mume TaxID=102107 RepID=A0ABM0NGP9_PRUMU|nr:PREDICTED: alpha-glucan phosphorylase, H isozyme-like [Prunus mume]XP_016647474.1 PREDICTED: alpha-glucan phosphorylase, H isozyme-like [Prunus mume]